MENLSACASLVDLSLAGNQIREIQGLGELSALRRLDLSSNWIQRIGGLEGLLALEFLDLKDNQITNIDDVSKLSPLPNLRHFSLRDYRGGKANPACEHPSYHVVISRCLPRLEILDGESLNLRKCMADVVLEKLEPDEEALQTGPQERWCKGIDWRLEPIEATVDRALGEETGSLQDLLHECSQLNKSAATALKAFAGSPAPPAR